MNKKIKQKILGITAVTLGLLTIIGLATTLGIVSNDQDEKLKTDLRAVRLVKNAISKDLSNSETKLKNSETKLKNSETNLHAIRLVKNAIQKDLSNSETKLKNSETNLHAIRLVKNAIQKDLSNSETKLKNSETKLKKLRSEYISYRRLAGTKFVTSKTRAEAYIRQLEAQLEQRLEKI